MSAGHDGGDPQTPGRSTVARTTLGLVAVVALAYAGATIAAEALRFGGTDDRASAAIAEARPEYRRWTVPVWSPGSRAAEVALFGLQALLGAAVLGWAVARLRRGRSDRSHDGGDPQTPGPAGGDP
jgi:cobalt/nickel transport protein